MITIKEIVLLLALFVVVYVPLILSNERVRLELVSGPVEESL